MPIPHILADEHIETYFKLAIAAIFLIGWAVKSVSNLAKPKPPQRAGGITPPIRQSPPMPRTAPPPMPRMAPPLARPPQMVRPLPIPRNMAQRQVMRPIARPQGSSIGRPIPPTAQPAASIILPALTALAQQPQPKKKKKAAKKPIADALQGQSVPLSSQATAVRSTGAGGNARARVAGWIDARTVRSEFLLAEALRPPLALRESHR